MLVYNVNNQINFQGKLIIGSNLSKNFYDYIPELNKMIENKPYNIHVYANKLYTKKGRIHRSTNFEVKNFRYNINRKHYNLGDCNTSTNKTKLKSYINAMQNTINNIDAKIIKARTEYKNRPLKEKLLDIIKNLLGNLFDTYYL